MSLHIRGPANVKQFAAYTVKDSKSDVNKRDTANIHLGHRGVHNVANKHNHLGHAKRDVVVATIDDQVVTWTADTAGYYVPPNALPANVVVSETSFATIYTTTCPVDKSTKTNLAEVSSKKNTGESSMITPVMRTSFLTEESF